MHADILTFIDSTHWREQKLSRSADRQQVIDELAGEIARKIKAGECVRLMFVCTHNSRRSQFAQVWAQAAAAHFGFDPAQLQCGSGGTETTACNPRTIASLERAGFVISRPGDESAGASENPKYLVSFGRSDPPVECYSKMYDADLQAEFIAVMCCDHAAETCPVVRGASARVIMCYDDPKASDDSPEEASTYDERSRQIGQDMWSVIGSVADLTRKQK